jgi:hypothetical protein
LAGPHSHFIVTPLLLTPVAADNCHQNRFIGVSGRGSRNGQRRGGWNIDEGLFREKWRIAGAFLRF